MAEEQKKESLRTLIRELKTIITNMVSPIWEILKKYPQQITAITAILGVLFLMLTLYQTKLQNKVTGTSFKQSYRPMGYIVPIKSGKDTYFDLVINKEDSLKVNLNSKKKFINKGKGALFLIGWLKFFKKKRVDFINKNLIHNIKYSNVVIDFNSWDNFDNKLPEARLISFSPKEEDIYSYQWSNINKEDVDDTGDEFYLYCIHLYKDLDNDLFETVYLEYYTRYGNIKDGKYIRTVVCNQFYHSYSKYEQNELADYIKKKHPDMASYIRR